MFRTAERQSARAGCGEREKERERERETWGGEPESVCCVCVRARQRGGRISRYENSEIGIVIIVILVRYVLKKVRRGPERVVAEAYGVLMRAKAGAGRYKRQRKGPTER